MLIKSNLNELIKTSGNSPKNSQMCFTTDSSAAKQELKKPLNNFQKNFFPFHLLFFILSLVYT